MPPLICALDFSGQLDDDLRREVLFTAELHREGKLVSRQTAFFVPTKHLDLKDPQITAQVSLGAGELRIDLLSRSLARLVELALEGADLVFSDNYFDLPAGRALSITAPLPADWTLARAQAALRVRSIYDSYEHGAAG